MQREAAAAGGGTTMCATEEKEMPPFDAYLHFHMNVGNTTTATLRDCPESCVGKWSLKPPVMSTAQSLKTGANET